MLFATFLAAVLFTQTEAPVYTGEDSLLPVIGLDGERKLVSSVRDWDIRRTHILANMQKVMGEMPPADRQVPLDVRIDGEQDFDSYTQFHLTYATETWDRTPALLLVPKNIDGKAPAMMALHQTWTDGKAIVADRGGSLPHLEYGRELAERGYVVLAPDYPGFGEYVVCRKELYENGYHSCTMKGIWNHMRGVDLLQSLDYVDPMRIGAIGHSLGGHNTLFLAAFDDRIQVAVTSCGFTNFAYYYGGDLTGWSHDGYMPRIASAYGKDPAQMPFDFSEVIAVIAPRAVFVNAPLQDANFDVTGVYAAVRMARPAFTITGARQSIVAMYPEAEHDFPDAERLAAYDFIDGVLKN